MSLKLYTPDLREVRLDMSTFPGGEPHVNSCELPKYTKRVLVDARVRCFNDFGELIVLTEYLKENGSKVDLFLPYMPGARQDRGNPLTAFIYANLINEQKYRTVTIVDPHSHVAPALLKRPHILNIDDTGVLDFLDAGRYDALICPDAGAAQRVERVAKYSGLPIHYARKHRDKRGVSIEFEGELPQGKYCVIDDILDGGATFVALKKEFDTLTDGTLDLWATHTIQDRGRFAVLHAGYQRLGTTDSFYEAREGSPCLKLWEAEPQPNVIVYPLFERMLNCAK